MRGGRTFGAVAAAAMVALAAGSAQAGKKDDTVVWLTSFEMPTTDFYAQTLREGVILMHEIWDTLVDVDPQTAEIKPNLAESWKWIDNTTLEMKLRQGVKFHNGEKFDADDVVYTFSWQLDPNNKHVAARSRVDWVKSVEKVDAYTVRLHLVKPFAPALVYLAQDDPIYPDEYTRAVGSEGQSAKPVGTGPYKVTEAAPGKHVIMVRNDDYVSSARPKPKVGKVVMRTVPETNTQIAELLAGNGDLIWRLPKDTAEKLGRMPDVKVVDGETMRFGYLQFELQHRAGAQPTDKTKVRQAIGYAINRESIVKNIFGGGRTVPLPCYPAQFGCASPQATTYTYDPAKAKALLAEAGYPNGFTIDFYGYRDRPAMEAMIGDLGKVGITAKLQSMQYSALRDKVRKGEVPMNFMTWGSGSIPDVANSTGYFFVGGPDDTVKDQKVIDLLKQGEQNPDRAKRKELYAEAIKIIMDNAYMIPLWSYSYFYGMNKDLNFTPTSDEIIHFYDMSWK